MMGFGFLSMLLVIALPIVGIVALVIWLSNANRKENLFGLNSPSEKQEQATGSGAKRFCSHCGAGLQAEWTHCPQCGAPVGS
jgi:hypothetical protein